MSATAEAVVDATGRNYTAMSYKEFANCYAEILPIRLDALITAFGVVPYPEA